MNLVLYHSGWPLFRPLLERYLSTPWDIAASANDPAWLAGTLPDADALLALQLPPEMRPLARRLKAVLFPGAGVMHSSADELPEGCVLLNVFEHEIPMAEYVMLAVLLHVTGLRRHSELFARGVWSGNGRTGGETHGEALGKTLGILGYGHIGREICRRAQAFGMRVEAVTRRPEVALADGGAEPDFLGSPSSLAAVLARSDF